MRKTIVSFSYLATCVLLLGFLSCSEENSFRNKIKRSIIYKKFSKMVGSANASTLSDTTNFLDQEEFNPFTDSISDLLNNIQIQLKNDSAELRRLGLQDSILSLNTPDPLMADEDSLTMGKDTFTNDIRKIQNEEIVALKFNLTQLKEIDSNQIENPSESCKQKACRVWAKISKSKQVLFLYVDGTLVDSFKVSTGDTNHETPLMDLRPAGPIFKKYTSKKFPGGNYNGLGNMPYVVFIQGGFAIHGTTTGNIPRLGNKASHGCVRLHPDNGKLFFELVKEVGLEHTWISIQN